MSEEEVVDKNPEVSEDANAERSVADVIKNLEDKSFTIHFFTPSLNHPSGGMGVLFKQIRILKDSGFNINVVFEPKVDEKASYEASMKVQKKVHVFEKFDPSWLDVKYDDIDFIPQVGTDEAGNKIELIQYNDGSETNALDIAINPEDFVIIPEGYPNVMAQLANSPCKKIILAQSWIYILNSLQPGQSWQTYGINDCITISDAITEYVNTVMPGMKIKQYSQSINRDLFNVPENMSDKAPLIGFSCSRGPENRMKTYNAIRNFQQWHPQYKWFRFVELTGMSREQYAEMMKSCAMVLYTDDIAGFGTMPLEAMASGTHVVGWAPYGGKEYITSENGFWSNNGDVFHLSEYLGIAVDKWINGELDSKEVQASYEKTLERYTEEKEKESVINIFSEYINERINELKGIQTK